MGNYKTIAIDFDGVISKYDGWKGIGVFGEPLPGVASALKHIKEMGWNIVIHTTRGEVSQIAHYLTIHDIPYDHINKNPQNFEHMNPGKPIADVYIDDRAICFTGEWTSDLVQEVLNFKPWYRKEGGDRIELRKNLLDLANYSMMTIAMIDGGEPHHIMPKISNEIIGIFHEKNKEYGNSFFNEGIENAFNDIRRKYKRVVQIMKSMGISMPKDIGE